MTGVKLRSGREVAVHRLAEGKGPTIVLCHSAPGSGAFHPDPDATRSRDVTLIGIDRPGYGGSEPVSAGEWASVDRAADDIAEILEALGAERVGVAGWSAGGRVALALAARHPELVGRVVVVGTPAPNEDVEWIPADLAAALEQMRGMPPEEIHAALVAQLGPMVAIDPASDTALALVGYTPADDETALALPGARERLAAMMAAAFAQGAIGMAGDICGYCLRPWGFRPSEVTARTLLLYGSSDPVAGSRHARWWKDHLPQARIEIAPRAGHLLIIPLWHRVLSFLAPGTLV